MLEDKKEKIMGVYAIYDKVAEESGPLFMAVNKGVALRNTVNILKPLPTTTRDDYKLIHVANYDLSTCEIEPIVPYTIDCEFNDLREVVKDEQ